MKTISLRKKVAAIAVASLGFGLLSVVPAQAATAIYTTVLGTVTPASPAVGSVVTIPLKLTLDAATENAAGTPTFTATYAHKPINTALVDTNLVADVVGSELATSGAALAVASAATNVITVTTGSGDITAFTAQLAGNFTFTPDTAGRYSVTITASAGNTFTATTAIVINVGGAALTQATSGKGATTGTATTTGSAVIAYTLPAPLAASSIINVTSSGVGAVTNGIGCVDQSTVLANAATAIRCSGTAVGAIATINGTNYTDGFKYTSGALITSGALTGSSKSETFTFDAASSVAGTQTISITGITLATGAPTALASLTITWGATPTVSTALSTSFACPGAVTSCSADATVLAAKTAKTSAADRAASILVTVRDSAGTSLSATQTITVTIAGPGTLALGTNAGAGSAGRALTGTAGQNLISVFGDGTEGKATITISQGTTVIATETVSFYGAVAKVTASQNLTNPLANGYLLGSANATSGTTVTAAASWANASGSLPAVQLSLTDASGNLIPSQAANISAVSSDATVMSKTITAVEDTTATYGAGVYNVSVSSASGSAAGKSATLTFRVLLADGTTYISSAPATFTTGSNLISKVAITLDKTTYTSGDPAVMTVKATDAAGLAVADGLYGSSSYAAPLFSKSVVAISTLPTTSTMVTIGGKKEYKFYAPSVPGAFTVTGTYINSDAGLVPTTGTASVTDGNAAIITQIDSLNAKIVALTALIAKIMKSLKIK